MRESDKGSERQKYLQRGERERERERERKRERKIIVNCIQQHLEFVVNYVLAAVDVACNAYLD